ncbi:PEGA domain-containing protein [Anaeromyxobacter diazotrophicus]|uniref:PEGA domain-containing protein n=1 Tax=Anaeromyxobacter diazotrophicus TaxID=2590199 RepID=A0A7I9VLA4_9BACT|nr:PEGA domain-containing protein [Anaeromyxobacter diazotrophicus]GEJ56900.1 hypothetical protein AMYX_16410 [Anaeromyxobacter diazotrophicus]
MRALLAALLLAAAAPAAGQDPLAAAGEATAQAKAHFRRGTELYRAARYRPAIAEFEAAWRLRPHGAIQYNLGQCHERLGELGPALAAYRAYLKAAPEAQDRRAVEALMAALAARLGARGVQQLFVESAPPGAEVSVDALPRGPTPLAAELPLGAHRLLLEKPGFAPLRREVVLAPDRTLELSLPLAPEAPLARRAPDLAPAAAAAPLSAGAGLAAPPEVKVSAGGARRYTWVAAGVAGAALVAGIAYGLAARSASAELRSSEHTGATAQQLAADAAARARNANVLYGVAAAAGAAGVTLFFLEGTF